MTISHMKMYKASVKLKLEKRKKKIKDIIQNTVTRHKHAQQSVSKTRSIGTMKILSSRQYSTLDKFYSLSIDSHRLQNFP